MGVEMAPPALRVGNELSDSGIYGHDRRTPEWDRSEWALRCGAVNDTARLEMQFGAIAFGARALTTR